MEIIKFGSDDIDNLLAQDPSRVENLPFGAVLVTPAGDILKYNHAEAGISSRSPDEVMGKNFFNDIAPCSKGHKFQNKFQEAVRTGQANTAFEYVFDYKMEPTKVMIHLKNSRDGNYWIFVKRL